MPAANLDLIQRLRRSIRAFEDRKIGGAELSREVYYVAREIDGTDQGQLRRTLEGLGNRVANLAERGVVAQVRPEIMNVADEIIAELVNWSAKS